MKLKRPPGRPPLGVIRYNITLRPEVADKLRRFGDGNLSLAITLLAKRVK